MALNERYNLKKGSNKGRVFLSLSRRLSNIGDEIYLKGVEL